MDFQKRVVVAKALRKSFNQTQRDLMKETFWGDEELVKMVREAQEQFTMFHELMDELRAEDTEALAAAFH